MEGLGHYLFVETWTLGCQIGAPGRARGWILEGSVKSGYLSNINHQFK